MFKEKKNSAINFNFLLIDCRGITGVIFFLMLLATIYDYRKLKTEPDVESTSEANNNNERNGTYIDKNFIEDRRISMIQENGKELIEKMRRESIQPGTKVKHQKNRGLKLKSFSN